MSQTNHTGRFCDRCQAIIAPGCGTLRQWNGAARKHAPKYTTRSAFGVLSACTCAACEREIGAAKRKS